MRILYAEDEADLNRIVTQKLTEAGYSVDAVFDGEEAVDFLMSAEYDAIVLDITMPKMNGIDVLQQLRSLGRTTPVLFLTARDAVADRVSGLDAGANDYLVKPFSFEELMARIRAMTRLVYGAQEAKLSIADLIMDLSAHKVTRGGIELTL